MRAKSWRHRPAERGEEALTRLHQQSSGRKSASIRLKTCFSVGTYAVLGPCRLENELKAAYLTRNEEKKERDPLMNAYKPVDLKVKRLRPLKICKLRTMRIARIDFIT